MGISGTCDVVEFHQDPSGVPLPGREGAWRVYPVEYKRGEPKDGSCDRLQLCAQAMCLEEMLSTHIDEGALYYGETHRRQTVTFDAALRDEAHECFAEMHRLFQRGYTPRPKRKKGCNACSMKDVCLPTLGNVRCVADYIATQLEETPQGKKRLRDVAKTCVNYGQRVQNSVFECALDAAQFAKVKHQLTALIDPQRDSLRFYNLGNNHQLKVTHIGAKPTYDPDQPLFL